MGHLKVTTVKIANIFVMVQDKHVTYGKSVPVGAAAAGDATAAK